VLGGPNLLRLAGKGNLGAPFSWPNRGDRDVGANELSRPGARSVPINSGPALSNLSDEEPGLELDSDLP
jgi:hypothetical protein